MTDTPILVGRKWKAHSKLRSLMILKSSLAHAAGSPDPEAGTVM